MCSVRDSFPCAVTCLPQLSAQFWSCSSTPLALFLLEEVPGTMRLQLKHGRTELRPRGRRPWPRVLGRVLLRCTLHTLAAGLIRQSDPLFPAMFPSHRLSLNHCYLAPGRLSHCCLLRLAGSQTAPLEPRSDAGSAL